MQLRDELFLTIELTDHCDMRCRICRQGSADTIHGDRAKTVMPRATVNDLLRSLIAPGEGPISGISLSWLGESLTHPDIVPVLRDVTDMNLQHGIFRNLVVHTNARLMTPAFIKACTTYARSIAGRAGFGFTIYLSLDAITPETYGELKQVPPSYYQSVITAVERLVAARQALAIDLPHLVFKFVVTELNHHEAGAFVAYWQKYLKKHSSVPVTVVTQEAAGLGDRIHVCCADTADKQEVTQKIYRKTLKTIGIDVPPSAPAGEEERSPSVRRPCRALWTTPTVSAQGCVVPCWFDEGLSLPVGSIRASRFADVWSSQQITALRLAHIRGQFWRYPTCAACAAYASIGVLSDAEVLTYLDENGMGFEGYAYQKRTVNGVARAEREADGTLTIGIVSREYPPETAWGGIGAYTQLLAEGLVRRGHRVHVISETLQDERTYEEHGVIVHRIRNDRVFRERQALPEFVNRLEYSVQLARTLERLHGQYRFDVIEGPNFAAELYVGALHKKVPIVTRLHTPFEKIIESVQWPERKDLRLSCWLEEAVIAKSDLILCSTKKNAETVLASGVPHARVAIVPLGIRPASAELVRPARRRGPVRILFVGRIEPRKGVYVLAKAIPRVLAAVPGAEFVFVGRDVFVTDTGIAFSGDPAASCKEHVLAMIPKNYRAKVSFAGYVPDDELRQQYAACDMLVAPSLYESFGFIYIEAMAYGKPVIGCETGGVPEVVEHGKTGLLVPPDDAKALAAAIVTLAKDRALRRKLGAAAQQRVAEAFSVERMVEATECAYRTVIA